VHPVTIDDYAKYPELKDEMKQFNEHVKEVIDVFDGSLVLQSEANEPEEALFVLVTGGTLPTDDGFEEDKVEVKDFDPLICAEVILLHKGGNMMAKVLGQKCDADGNLVGCRNCIPTMDSHIYEVKFLDGIWQHIAYNILAEHLLSGVDSEGNQFQIFKEIIDHWKDKHAIEIADQYYKKNGCHYKKKMMTGWELEVEWKDGTSPWLPLKTLKETNLVQVADYACSNKIDMEPAFDWWVTTVLQRRNWIIKCAMNRRHHIGYKFGIPLPSSVADAECLDRINGKTLWMDALCKEMEAVRIAFEVQDESVTHIPGYKKILGHVVWDVKMDFTQKAHYVAGGHCTDPPKSITYSSVILHESV